MTVLIEEPPVPLGTPRFYAEDMEKMTQIVIDACEHSVKVEASDWRAFKPKGDELAVFSEHNAMEGSGKRLKNLTIWDTRISGDEASPEIVVSFSAGGAFLILTSPSKTVREAAGQIKDLCEERSRRSRKRRAIWSPGLVYVLMLLYAGATSLRTFSDFALNGAFDGTSWHMLAMLPLCGVLCLLLRRSQDDTGWPKLVNAPRPERPSWWQKHRKEAFLLFLGGCVNYVVNPIPTPTQLLGGD